MTCATTSRRGIGSLTSMLTVAAMLLPATPGSAQTRIKSGFNVFSRAQEIEIGRESAAKVERDLHILDRGEAADLVAELGGRLAGQAAVGRFEYTFKVVDAPELNAFALPGGPIFVNRGILEAARTDGEVAAVLAHEIAHVALRHGTHNASKAYLGQAGLGILGGLIGGEGSPSTSEIVSGLGGFGLNTLFLKYSRRAETEADVMGAQILVRAGYNPADMVSFFRTIAAAEKSRTASWLSSHPSPERRIERIEREATLLGVALGPTTASARLRAAQQALRGSAGRVVGTRNDGRAPRPAIDPPSREARTYRSPSRIYRLEVPSNWEVVQESETGVTLAPPGGVRRQPSGALAIVVGAIVNHYRPFGSQPRSRGAGLVAPGFDDEITLEAATDDLLDALLRASPYLRPARGARRLRLEDVPALTATLTGTSPSTGQRERVVVVTRQLDDGHLVYLLFVTGGRDEAANDGVLEDMVRTMHVDEAQPHRG